MTDLQVSRRKRAARPQKAPLPQRARGWMCTCAWRVLVRGQISTEVVGWVPPISAAYGPLYTGEDSGLSTAPAATIERPCFARALGTQGGIMEATTMNSLLSLTWECETYACTSQPVTQVAAGILQGILFQSPTDAANSSIGRTMLYALKNQINARNGHRVWYRDRLGRASWGLHFDSHH
ncbi:hypothetical protein BC834DRAFT_609608 [Gloeopeniophorella convolvens]|nr:hypothetical protein BC834DRAFT_609608 [Gloeopeniophorella convolvens]